MDDELSIRIDTNKLSDLRLLTANTAMGSAPEQVVFMNEATESQQGSVTVPPASAQMSDGPHRPHVGKALQRI